MISDVLLRPAIALHMAGYHHQCQPLLEAVLEVAAQFNTLVEPSASLSQPDFPGGRVCSSRSAVGSISVKFCRNRHACGLANAPYLPHTSGWRHALLRWQTLKQYSMEKLCDVTPWSNRRLSSIFESCCHGLLVDIVGWEGNVHLEQGDRLCLMCPTSSISLEVVHSLLTARN